jgi:diguanylate cyclase (GGDEF)-like protein
MASWSTQQLVEFLAGISACVDHRSALRDAVERAAEALEAEVAAVVRDDIVIASTGFPAGEAPAQELAAVARGEATTLTVPGVGECAALSAMLDEASEGWLIVARASEEPFNHEDISVFRGMARVLVLTLRQLRLIESERALRERSQREVSDRRAAQQQLAHQVMHDALTGLPNRTLLLDRLDRALKAARRDDTIVAVLFVDVDNFKLINDTLGHHVGDDLLRLVADRLRDSVRLSESGERLATDTVARFGGDEFVLVGEGLGSADDAHHIADRIAARFAQPFMIAGEQLFVTASTGVAISDTHSTAHSLIRDADAAMYHAKAHGRARTEIFDDAMRGRLLERLDREKDMRRAIERGEFVLHYQPIFDVGRREIVGAEALIRWHHPVHGLTSADKFIPLAEETGLITQIDEWVIQEACTQLATWQRSEMARAGLSVSVNLSARQVEDGRFLAALAGALDRSGADPHSLGLEITESVLIENTASPIAVLDALRRLGPRLILDDFGTGYSSLSYLQRFPLDALKLDRAFVAGIAEPGRDRDIVAALLHLANVLELAVVAEGVETEAQFACLRELACPFVQGYHLARPMPAAELEALVLASPPASTNGAHGAIGATGGSSRHRSRPRTPVTS